MPSLSVPGFIWVQRIYSKSGWAVLLKGVSQTTHTLWAEFSKALAPNVGGFRLVLDNNNGSYSDSYAAGDAVEFRYDLEAAGTTTRFKGEIDRVDKRHSEGEGDTLEIIGTHLSGELLDISVMESYDGTVSTHSLIQSAASKYFPNYTTNNVQTSSSQPTISFNGVPFLSAVAKLAEVSDMIAYADDDRDIHLFSEGGIENDNEAVVFGDTLISLGRLGSNAVDVKNKIIVEGADNEGLPVLSTRQDSVSQSASRVKERILLETDVTTIAQAQQVAQLQLRPTASENGNAMSYLLPTLEPGDSIYFVDPTQNLLARHVIVRFTHRIPDNTTELEIADTRTLADLFADRIEKEQSIELIKNRFKLNYSFNLTFDSTSDGDVAASTPNVAFANGEIYLTSGSSGTFISKSHTAPINASQVHLKAVGEALSDTLFDVSSDNGNLWQQVSLEALTSLNAAGNLLRLRIRMNVAGVRIKSAALLYS